MRECDLYAPVKALLEGQGYVVRGEVNGCDLVGVRGDDLVVVELKVSFSLALVLQGIDRQRLTDHVYLAVPAPRRGGSGPRWNEIRALCRRLEIGLIYVHLTSRGATVEVVCDPEPHQPRKKPKATGRLLREFQRRSGDHNLGGTTGRPVVTAYREAALQLAAHLQQQGPTTPRGLRAATGVQQAGAILQADHYGWFERVARGLYQLTPKGEQALLQYADVLVCQTAAGSCPDDK